MPYYVLALGKTFDLDGRATRPEFWLFILFDILFQAVRPFLSGWLTLTTLSVIFLLDLHPIAATKRIAFLYRMFISFPLVAVTHQGPMRGLPPASSCLGQPPSSACFLCCTALPARAPQERNPMGIRSRAKRLSPVVLRSAHPGQRSACPTMNRWATVPWALTPFSSHPPPFGVPSTSSTPCAVSPSAIHEWRTP